MPIDSCSERPESMTVFPGKGIGTVRLGMTREQVRAILGVAYQSIMRGPYAVTATDHFDQLWLQVDYDADDVCNLINAIGPANPVLFGKHPTKLTHEQCTQWLLTLDPDLIIESDSLISKKLGVTTYTSLGPDEPVECVGVFVDGYYDDML
jgi:hypothetical protein